MLRLFCGKVKRKNAVPAGKKLALDFCQISHKIKKSTNEFPQEECGLSSPQRACGLESPHAPRKIKEIAMKQPILIPAGERIRLNEFDPEYTGKYKDKDEAEDELEKNVARMAELQEVLYAEGKHALLIVLQAMDAGGKDGVIRNVMSGVNPQGCRVTGFKAPTPEELAHDFLWRIHEHVPPRGYVGIFNRSHYEDVLVVRVHNLVPEAVWQQRYEHINNFEKLLADSGVTIMKFFLHISKDEQKERLEERLKDKSKNWKFNPGDLKARARWEEYMQAYEDAINRCSTPWAPWHVIPANKKWYRNLAISERLVEVLESLDMKYPPAPEGIEQVVIE
jgi:PPK2 family polyphosphate:nucleotide phosphotransferase